MIRPNNVESQVRPKVQPDYLCFTANTAGSTIKLRSSGSMVLPTLETSTDLTNWSTYTINTDTITLNNVGDKVYWRNTSETTVRPSTSTSKYLYYEMTGSIAVSGDLGFFINKNSTDTIVGTYALAYLFRNCPITSCPKINFINITAACLYGMFYYCTSLEVLPKLYATALQGNCYGTMFQGCSKIKLSTTQTGEYQTPYRIPAEGTGTTASGALGNMFTSTGGTFTSNPTINTTYYTSNTVV